MTEGISVVLPAYNRFHMLVPVLESILGQTLPAAEIIVVDDGSEDETKELLPRYIQERPGWCGKVRYIRQDNQGQSAAVNRGIAEARTEWIAFSSHDDLWLPWKLEWQMRAVERADTPCSLCFTDAWFMNNPHMKGTLFQQYGISLPGATGVVREPVRLIADCQYPVWVQTILARTDVIRRGECFDPILRYMEDQDFVFRMGLLTPFCYVSMPMVLIDRSPSDIRHTGEATNWHKVEFRLRMDQRRLETQLRLSKSLPSDLQKKSRRNLAANHSHWANLSLDRGDFGKARSEMLVATSYDRSLRMLLKFLLIEALPYLASALYHQRARSAPPRYDQTSWKATTGAQHNSAS